MYSRINSWTRVGFAACFALTLTACGGGGGSSGGTPATTTTTATITGTAGKGLLSGATITFYSVGSNGQKGSSVGSGTTDSSGNFSVSITAGSGPLIAEITVSSGTLMQDEISGQNVAAPSGLTLHAVFNGATALNSLPLAISPVTEIGYQAAGVLSGGYTSTNIDTANNGVSQVLLNGSPALSTLPIDITKYSSSTPSQQALAKLSTALSVAASNGTATGSNGSACSGGYPADITCLAQGLGSLVSISSSGSAAATQAAGYVSNALSQIDSDAVQVAGGSPSALGIDQTNASEVGLVTSITTQASIQGFKFDTDPVKNTKDVFSNIRQNIVDASISDSYGFNTTAKAIGTDVNTNVAPASNAILALLNDVLRAVDLLSASTPGDSGQCTYDPAQSTTSAVVCDGHWNESEIEEIITRNTDGSYSVVTQPASSYLQWQNDNSNNVEYIVPALNSTYATLTAKFTVNQGSSGNSYALSGPLYVTGSGGQISANITATDTTASSSNLSGDISLSGSLSGGAGGISLTSAIISNDTVLHIVNGTDMLNDPMLVSVQTIEANCRSGDASSCADIDLDYYDFYNTSTGAIVASGSCSSYSVSGASVICTAYSSYTDSSTGDPLSAPPSGAVTGLDAFKAGINNVYWVSQPHATGLVTPGNKMALYGEIDFQNFTTSQFSYSASITLGTPVYDKSGRAGFPNSVSLAGSIAQVTSGSSSTTPVFNGTVTLTPKNVGNYDATQPVSASNSVAAEADVTGQLNLSGSRVLSVSLTADATLIDTSKAANNSGSFTASYSYQTPGGSFALNASGSYDPTHGWTGKLTSNTGVVVTLTDPIDGQLSGTATATDPAKNTAVNTATISGTTINYSDGSTASLF